MASPWEGFTIMFASSRPTFPWYPDRTTATKANERQNFRGSWLVHWWCWTHFRTKSNAVGFAVTLNNRDIKNSYILHIIWCWEQQTALVWQAYYDLMGAAPRNGSTFQVQRTPFSPWGMRLHCSAGREHGRHLSGLSGFTEIPEDLEHKMI